jgi:hypothetical protein
MVSSPGYATHQSRGANFVALSVAARLRYYRRADKELGIVRHAAILCIGGTAPRAFRATAFG